jgi:hypothetical protein
MQSGALVLCQSAMSLLSHYISRVIYTNEDGSEKSSSRIIKSLYFFFYKICYLKLL